MKSAAKFWAQLIVASMLCLSPCAHGESTASRRAFQPGNHPVSGFLVYSVVSGKDSPTSIPDVCDGRAKICKTAVPEGGSTITFLALAGITCLAAVEMRRRRKPSQSN